MVWGDFCSPSSLISLSGVVPQNFTFENMTDLETLTIAFKHDTVGVDTSPLCSTSLSGLVYRGNDFSHFSSLVTCLQSITSAKFDSSGADSSSGNISVTFDLPLLKFFYIYISFSESDPQLNIAGDVLEELHVYVSKSMVLNVTAPMLKIFHLRSHTIPSSLTSFKQLEVLTVTGPFFYPQRIPNMSFAPNLHSLELRAILINDTDLNELLSSLPVTMEALTLATLNSQVPQIVSLPTSWNSLKSLSVAESYTITFDRSSILGKSSLEKLETQGDVISTLEDLYALSNLQYVSLVHSLSITEIPAEFFTRMNQLKYFALVGQSFTGTIPHRGWKNLETVSISGSFTSWPAIDNGSNLKSLHLSSVSLTMIPSENSFIQANLLNLEAFMLSARNLRAFPFFWTDLPNIRSVSIPSTRYAGPMASSISARRLQTLSMQDNSFCGILPTISVPMHLELLNLGNNQLSGTIPKSWEDNLSLTSNADLHNNYLSGSIPSNLFNHHSSYMRLLSLSSNPLSGPLWNMSSGVPTLLDIASTRLQVCARNPDIRQGPNSTLCRMSTIPECPSQCPDYWSACKPPLYCTVSSYDKPSPPTCSPPSIDCPLPQPGTGFQCNRGTWIFTGNSTEGSIILPPAAGPVIIFGNLSTNGTITFKGTGTSVEVQGCVLNAPSQIVIELPSGTTPDSLTLIIQRGKNCATDLSKIPVVLVSSNQDCNALVVSTSSSFTSLTALFSIENRCPKAASSHTRWIILGSTLGGILVLLCISAVLLHLKSPAFRTFIRSCSVRKALAATK